MDVDGLLLCSKCENQLKVSPYKGGHGFFAVEPCVHCAATQQAVQAELLSDDYPVVKMPPKRIRKATLIIDP